MGPFEKQVEDTFCETQGPELTRDDAVKRIAFLNCWKHMSHETIGERIGLQRHQVRAIALKEEDIETDAANRLIVMSRKEGFDEAIRSCR